MLSNIDDFLKPIGLGHHKSAPTAMKLYAIRNHDGSPRWIWNSANPNPDFLRFYAISSFRSKVFSLLVKSLFHYRLQHLIFRRHCLYATRNINHVIAPCTQGNFALFTGTPGPNRKLILFAGNRFVKVALNETSSKLIENEKSAISQIQPGHYTTIPQSISVEKGIVSLSDLGSEGKRSYTFTRLHAAALSELQDQHASETITFNQSKSDHAALTMDNLQQGKSFNQIPPLLIDKINVLAETIAHKNLLFTWAHRDFTPWNCFLVKDKVNLYDFELAHPRLPFGYDAFHFIMQQGILVERIPWLNIKPKLKAAFAELENASGRNTEDFDLCLKAYLVINLSYYLKVYSMQEKWHVQVQWLLNTWNDALSDLLSPIQDQRALIIGDVFDFLHNQSYAAVKFPEIPPITLSPYSDIDLLMYKNTARMLIAFLNHHSLIRKVCLQQQSHMMSVQLVLQNGQLLALDLIWQLKRKSLEFMEIDQAILTANTNKYGIKCLNQENTESYLRLFYGLNGSPIPAKYYSIFKGNVPNQSPYRLLRKEISTLQANNGVSAWLNACRYALDIARRLFSLKGMVITFSGVDGAGKSTVIEHTKAILEKKLRREVVVIRHRPSLLPILSAITQGKKAAEQKAASTLPRQGSNKSLPGSFFRFAYYYTDYLFGQFYVYTKHVLQGRIVLYDRYYFDFINDSLRSNIRLPKWLTKAAYKLLLKPDINFFLYADPKTILSRKKELDEAAITQLTIDYLTLFKDLGARSTDRYFPIENLQLQNTLAIITAKAQAKLLRT